MTHDDSRSFADKHPAGAAIDPEIQNRIGQKAANQRLSCAAAHRIARDLSIDPGQVGMTLDLMNYKIARCQLGLFGYQPGVKPVSQAPPVEPELTAILRAAARDQRISCRKIWEIAAAHRIPRMAVAKACDALELKIRPCQLGAF